MPRDFGAQRHDPHTVFERVFRLETLEYLAAEFVVRRSQLYRAPANLRPQYPHPPENDGRNHATDAEQPLSRNGWRPAEDVKILGMRHHDAKSGDVAGIVDLAGRRDWLAALPSLATQPRLLGRGAG